MTYPFPCIAASCPICGGACGAIYRGYYRRWAVVPESNFIGRIAIRTGFCKARQRRFALFPSFMIPFRSFSRTAILWLWRAWIKAPGELVQAVDRWFEGIGREVYLSLSTLYSQLRFTSRQLHAGHTLFRVRHFSPTALSGVLEVPQSEIEAAILHPAFGLAASLRIDPPP